jgi:hypothetical protein
MNRVTYEIQLQPKDGKYWFVLTMSTAGQYWTSRPVKLEATEEQAAFEEAAEQVRRLRRAMQGEVGDRV